MSENVHKFQKGSHLHLNIQKNVSIQEIKQEK